MGIKTAPHVESQSGVEDSRIHCQVLFQIGGGTIAIPIDKRVDTKSSSSVAALELTTRSFLDGAAIDAEYVAWEVYRST